MAQDLIDRFQSVNPETEFLVEVTDREDVQHFLHSTTSDCWSAGARLDESGDFIELARLSPQHRGDKRPVFFCRRSTMIQENQSPYAW